MDIHHKFSIQWELGQTSKQAIRDFYRFALRTQPSSPVAMACQGEKEVKYCYYAETEQLVNILPESCTSFQCIGFGAALRRPLRARNFLHGIAHMVTRAMSRKAAPMPVIPRSFGRRVVERCKIQVIANKIQWPEYFGSKIQTVEHPE